MRNYFDGHLYFCNLGSRSLNFRFPLSWVDPEMISTYEVENAVESRVTRSHLILSFALESNPGDYDDEESRVGILSSLLAIRQALANGDTRALYFGWLSAVQHGLVNGSSQEPPVPASLGAADDALESLAGFLHVSDDLLKAAAKSSSPNVPKPTASDVGGWLKGLGSADKDRWLSRILLEDDGSSVREIRRLLLALNRPLDHESCGGRTVDRLLAEAREIERLRIDQEKRDADQARQGYLRALVGQENELWKSAIKLSESSSEHYQDSSIRILTDLRDLAGLLGTTGEFQKKLEGFIELRRRKSSVMKRLERVGFM